jgi:hypothetical protein
VSISFVCLVALVREVLPDFGTATAVLDAVEVARIDRLVVRVVEPFRQCESASYNSGATSAEACCRGVSRFRSVIVYR